MCTDEGALESHTLKNAHMHLHALYQVCVTGDAIGACPSGHTTTTIRGTPSLAPHYNQKYSLVNTCNSIKLYIILLTDLNTVETAPIVYYLVPIQYIGPFIQQKRIDNSSLHVDLSIGGFFCMRKGYRLTFLIQRKNYPGPNRYPMHARN